MDCNISCQHGIVRWIGKIRLPQAEQAGAEFVLELHAVQAHGDVEPGEHIFAHEHAMTLLHVVELDGEDVGRALDIFAGE